MQRQARSLEVLHYRDDDRKECDFPSMMVINVNVANE